MNQNEQLCFPNGVMFDALGEPRVRYVRVTLDGHHCLVRPEDVADYTAQGSLLEDQPPYILTDTYLSEREFDDLPEFDGF